MFPAVFNLTNLDGNNGFAINGIYSGDGSGSSVSEAGDVNGDGIADIIIGASSANSGAGQSYVIFGSKSGFTTPFNLTDLNGNNGFAISGINGGKYGDESGYSVSGAGDVNGDGIADIIIGAPGAIASAGQSYVIFGSKSEFTTPFNLNDLNGNNGFAINGINNGDISGGSVSGAGDVNGDGIADIIIGAPDANNYSGQSYVIFGSKSGFTTPFLLSNLNSQNGFAINGINCGDYSSISVSGAGDVNNDGIADIIIGASQANSYAGQSYVIFGSKSGFITPFNIADLNGNNGFAINGISRGDDSGRSVSGAGDVNGDGIADIIIGADGAGHNTGQSYVIFGSRRGFTTPFDLTDLNSNNGFAINGINYGDDSGRSVSGAGDVNGDGIADIIIGATDVNYVAGQSYVIFGSKSGFTTPFDLTDLNGNNGFAINGINRGDRSGLSVSGAGDVNGDGIVDMIIGAPSNNNNLAGQSYVVFGMFVPVPLASSSQTPSHGSSQSYSHSSSDKLTPTPTSSLSFTTSPSNTPEPIPSHNNVPGDNHELSVGAIAGIAVGAATGIALIGAGIAWYGKTHGWWLYNHVDQKLLGIETLSLDPADPTICS